MELNSINHMFEFVNYKNQNIVKIVNWAHYIHY